MKVVAWNVNSIKARHERVHGWLQRHQPDIVCLQELKMEEKKYPFESLEALGYHSIVYGQKTYNGVAILSKKPIELVARGFGDGLDDPQARMIHGRIEGGEKPLHILSTYIPNGQKMHSDAYRYKLSWLKRLRAYLDAHLDRFDDVLVCGDFNNAPDDRDVASPETYGGTVLCDPEVRRAVKVFEGFGLFDTQREVSQEAKIYTWWDYRQAGFERNDGLRIDFVYATRQLAERCNNVWVDREERIPDSHPKEKASDHAPVVAEFTQS